MPEKIMASKGITDKQRLELKKSMAAIKTEDASLRQVAEDLRAREEMLQKRDLLELKKCCVEDALREAEREPKNTVQELQDLKTSAASVEADRERLKAKLEELEQELRAVTGQEMEEIGKVDRHYRYYGRSADLWSFGIATIEVFTNKLPFEGEFDFEIVEKQLLFLDTKSKAKRRKILFGDVSEKMMPKAVQDMAFWLLSPKRGQQPFLEKLLEDEIFRSPDIGSVETRKLLLVCGKNALGRRP